MAKTRQDILNLLTEQTVEYELFDHESVMTVDAQEKALSGTPGTVACNLFLKDKKKRLYILTVAPSTKVDLQVLSARLGVGKGGIRLAPEELIGQVLQVPLGSVTPLALANSSAADVGLLLDEKLKAAERIFVHPLVNTSSIAVSPAMLDAAIRAIGREPVYADLEVEPKIDRDNPPDLKHIADAAKPYQSAVDGADASVSVAAAASASVAAAAALAALRPSGPASGGVASTSGPSGAAAAATTATARLKPAAAKPASKATPAISVSAPTENEPVDVMALAEALLQRASEALLGKKLEGNGVDRARLQGLRADLEMQLNAVRNTSYANGYHAGRGEILAMLQRR